MEQVAKLSYPSVDAAIKYWINYMRQAIDKEEDKSEFSVPLASFTKMKDAPTVVLPLMAIARKQAAGHITPEIIEKVEAALKRLCVEELSTGWDCIISVDYHPDWLLAKACEESDLDPYSLQGLWPFKTAMRVSKEGYEMLK